MSSSSELKSFASAEKPQIMPVLDGPLYLINTQTPRKVENLQNSRGEPISKIVSVAMCRCGASNNKPFCDGMHLSVNFKDEKS